MTNNNQKYLPFVMWLFPLSFFTFQFILRLWPGLMMNQIMEQFAIDASSFGLLAALYYYGYSGMQIPVAIMLDKFKVRHVVFIFASLCGIGMLIFTLTNNWYLACFSRFLIGVGSAVGFLGTSKVIADWFPKSKYAQMVGYSFTIGLMGAIYGGKPISLLIQNYSWQNVAIALSIASMAIGCCTLLLLRSKQNKNNEDIQKEEFKLENFKKLLASPIMWLLALANLFMVGSLEGFADVWGVQYLITAYNLPKPEAAELISFIFVGMIFGGPILAYLSTKMSKYKVIAISGILMATSFILLLFFINDYNKYCFIALFLLVGIMCCYQVIVFATGADLVSPKLLGVTVAFLNCINMLGGSFFHSSIGYAMDLFWSGSFNSDGLRHYDLHSYNLALSVIPIFSILGALMVLFIEPKEAKKE